MRILLASLAVILSTLTGAGVALAAGLGKPEPWQMDLQVAVTPSAEGIASFHTLLLWIIIPIALFVLGLMIYVLVRFNEKANPEPSTVTHNTTLEFVWTVVPILILVVIAIPSFRLLYLQRDIPQADLTIKATGNQWYWTYEYPEHKSGDGEAVSFDAVMKTKEELKDGEPYLLATDTPVVVPVNAIVKVIVTASDVLHAWAVPSFGTKMDAVPGRLNETWFKAEKEGIYYGQCSELCGKDHAYMPIEVRVVSEAAYKKWLEETKTAGIETAVKNLIAHMDAKTATRKLAKLKNNN